MVQDRVYLPNPLKERRQKEFIEYVFRFIIGALFGAFIGWLPAYRVYPIAYGSLDRILAYALLIGIVTMILEEHVWKIVGFLSKALKRGNCWNQKA